MHDDEVEKSYLSLITIYIMNLVGPTWYSLQSVPSILILTVTVTVGTGWSIVPVRDSHVAIGESSKEMAKPNLLIIAILAKSISISFS